MGVKAVNPWLRCLVTCAALSALVMGARGAHVWFVANQHKRAGNESPTAIVEFGRERAQPEELQTEAVEESDENFLRKDESEYLFAIEKVALLLDVHTFPRIANSISERDSDELATFLSDDFVGFVPDSVTNPLIRYPFGQFGSLNRSDVGWRSVAKNDFIAFVIAQSSRVPQPRTSNDPDAPAVGFLARDPHVEVRLMRLAPAKRRDMQGLWHGTLKFRFAGLQPSGKPGELELAGRFTFDGPGIDIAKRQKWLRSCEFDSYRWRESSSFLFREVAEDRGVDRGRFHDNWVHPEQRPSIVTGGVYLCDYDHDGRIDVLITDLQGFALFHGESEGNFTDATESSLLADQIRSGEAPAIFVDLDGDAYEELLIGNQVFQNNRNGTFSDVTMLTNIRIPEDAGSFAVADYDRDGRMDVYILRASPGPVGRSRVSWVDDQTGPGNQLWRNMDHWRFRNVTAPTNASAGHRSCFAGAWLDANSDGWPDLAVSDEFGSSVLLVNHRGARFTEHILKEPFGGFCMGIVAGDLDNDGHIDLYLSNMSSKAGDRIISNLPSDAYTSDLRAKVKEFVTGNELLRNTGSLWFEPLTRQTATSGPGWSYGANMIDFNNDGWLDIYAPGGFISHSRGEPDG